MVELYREHRPTKFSQVVGQTSTVKQLKNCLKNDRLPHALLFTGGSGVGKTTLGRIIASELDCHKEEFFEINSADFRGIEMIREIRQSVNYAPMRGSVKVWLIDECHALSRQAEEAMLKLLEDPPEHVYFILCTTDPSKLLKTTRTRCTEFALKEFSNKALVSFLAGFMGDHLEVDISKKTLEAIAEKSAGSPRKALVALEGLIALDEEDQKAYVENLQDEETKSIVLCRALLAGAKWKEVAGILKELKDDPESIRYHVLAYARTVLLGAGGSADKAFVVIDCFQENFYDSKHAGLAAACWSVLNGDEK